MNLAFSEVNGQAAQPVPLASLKLSMVVYGQKLDGNPPVERTKQLTPPSFRRDVKLGVPCLGASYRRPKLAGKARYNSPLKIK